MSHVYTDITGYLWGAWALYWYYASRGVKSAVYVQTRKDRFIYLGQVGLTFLLLYAAPLYVGPFSIRLWKQNEIFGVLGVFVTVVSLGFMVWARIHLAGNWSATVTLKKDHELIQSGPYGITRHPIYTGFIGGILGAALTVGELRAALALVIIIYATSIKIRYEETVLKKEFQTVYADYTRRVKRLIPFIY